MDTVKLATALGLTSSAALGGLALGLSLFTIPTILTAPPKTILTQWRHLYNRGARYAPPFAILAAATLSYAAYRHYHDTDTDPEGTKWRGLVFAAVGTVAIMPFTLLALVPTNNKLIAASEGAKMAEREVSRLVGKWGFINAFRAFLPLTAVMVGLWTNL